MPEPGSTRRTRRRALEAIAAATVALPTAGCLGSGTVVQPEDVQWIENPATVHRGVPATPEFDLPEDVFAAVHVARDDSAEDVVWIWNDSDEARELVVDLRADGTVLFDRAVAFPPDGVVEVALFARSTYRIDAGPPGSLSTVEFPVSRFDCNDHALDVRIGPDGTVETGVVRTDVGCG